MIMVSFVPAIALSVLALARGVVSVTGVAYRHSFIPFVGYVGDSVLTGHAAIGNGRPPGAFPVTLAGRIPPFAARLAQDSAVRTWQAGPASPFRSGLLAAAEEESLRVLEA